MFSQTLHGVVSTSTPTDNDDRLFATLLICLSDSPLVGLQGRPTVFRQDISHVGSDENLAVFLFGVEFV